ncbi:RNA demethylase ALKBH9B [Cardamine amara subsp. amara]|uniref:RNA demethylase ALKBH9B n=1 Tax=Cardamine amara subsp. amara TaxID=228776 RepID=A0ABD1BEP0_CARAN
MEPIYEEDVFLGKDLCKDCVHVLSDRIRSLDPEHCKVNGDDKGGSGSMVENMESEEIDNNMDALPSQSTVSETSSPRMSWADMTQEDGLEEEEQKDDDVSPSIGGDSMKTPVKRKLPREEREPPCDLIYELQDKGRKGELQERTFTAPHKWMRGKGRVTIQFGCCYYYATDKAGNPPEILQNGEVDPIPSLFKVIAYLLISITMTSSVLSALFHSSVSAIYSSDQILKSSVLVLKGNGADVAKHCVPAVPTKRISITFRKMDESKRPVGFIPEPDLQEVKPLPYEQTMPSTPTTAAISSLRSSDEQNGSYNHNYRDRASHREGRKHGESRDYHSESREWSSSRQNRGMSRPTHNIVFRLGLLAPTTSKIFSFSFFCNTKFCI